MAEFTLAPAPWEKKREPAAAPGGGFSLAPAPWEAKAVAPDEEQRFRSWYSSWAKKLDLDPNPDAPEHGYDYRAAFKAGVEPQYVENTDNPGWYWPSVNKSEDHPRRFLVANKDGANIWGGKGPAFDTLTGKWLTQERAALLQAGEQLPPPDLPARPSNAPATADLTEEQMYGYQGPITRAMSAAVEGFPGEMAAAIKDRGVGQMIGSLGGAVEMAGRKLDLPEPVDPERKAALDRARGAYGPRQFGPVRPGAALPAITTAAEPVYRATVEEKVAEPTIAAGARIQEVGDRRVQESPRPAYAQDGIIQAAQEGRPLDAAKTLLLSAGESLPTFASIVGASLIAGPAGGSGMAFAQESGAAYREAKAAGATEEEAQSVAGIVGATNMLLEYMPAGKLLRGIKGVAPEAKKTMVRRMVEQAVAEGSTETLQGLNQRVTQAIQVAAESGMTGQEFVTAAIESIEEGMAGALVGGGTGLATPSPVAAVDAAKPPSYADQITSPEHASEFAAMAQQATALADQVIEQSPVDAPLKARVPRWASDLEDAAINEARWLATKRGDFTDEDGGFISPEDLPFELSDLPLTEERGGFYTIGVPGKPSAAARREIFTPQLPLIYIEQHGTTDLQREATVALAESEGFDSVVFVPLAGFEKARLAKTGQASEGLPISSDPTAGRPEVEGLPTLRRKMQEAGYEPLAPRHSEPSYSTMSYYLGMEPPRVGPPVRAAGQRLSEPLPLPELHGVKPEQVADAWAAVSARYPTLASRVKRIAATSSPLAAGFVENKPGPDTIFVNVNPVLNVLNEGTTKVKSALLVHELAHIGQMRTHDLDPIADHSYAEGQAAKFGNAYRGKVAAGYGPRNYANLRPGALLEIATQPIEGSAIQRIRRRYEANRAVQELDRREVNYLGGLDQDQFGHMLTRYLEGFGAPTLEGRFTMEANDRADAGSLTPQLIASLIAAPVEGDSDVALKRKAATLARAAVRVGMEAEANDLARRVGAEMLRRYGETAKLPRELMHQDLIRAMWAAEEAQEEESQGTSYLATQSQTIGQSQTSGPVEIADILAEEDGATKVLRALSPAGDEVGELRYVEEPGGGGFRVDSVTTGVRGSGVGRRLYREAFNRSGPYRGSVAQAEEGEGFVNRLRETDPDIFQVADEAPRISSIREGEEAESDPFDADEALNFFGPGLPGPQYVDPGPPDGDYEYRKDFVYRNPRGQPIFAATVVSQDGGETWRTEALYRRKGAATLLDGRAARLGRKFIVDHNALGASGSISEDARAVRQRYLASLSRPPSAPALAPNKEATNEEAQAEVPQEAAPAQASEQRLLGDRRGLILYGRPQEQITARGKPAPIVAIEVDPDSDAFVISFDLDSGRELTAEEVELLLPPIPDGHKITLGGRRQTLRPDLQRVSVKLWKPDDPRSGVGRAAMTEMANKLRADHLAGPVIDSETGAVSDLPPARNPIFTREGDARGAGATGVLGATLGQAGDAATPLLLADNEVINADGEVETLEGGASLAGRVVDRANQAGFVKVPFTASQAKRFLQKHLTADRGYPIIYVNEALRNRRLGARLQRVDYLSRDLESMVRKYKGPLSKKQLRRYLDDAYRGMNVRTGAENLDATQISRLVRRAMERRYGKNATPEQVAQSNLTIEQQIVGAIERQQKSESGGLASAEQFLPIIRELRNETEALTREMRRLGLMDDAVARQLERTYGLYVHRQYELHRNKKWADLLKEKRSGGAKVVAGLPIEPLLNRAFDLTKQKFLRATNRKRFDYIVRKTGLRRDKAVDLGASEATRTATTAREDTHVVTDGESIDSIATAYGMSPAALAKLNGREGSYVTDGELEKAPPGEFRFFWDELERQWTVLVPPAEGDYGFRRTAFRDKKKALSFLRSSAMKSGLLAQDLTTGEVVRVKVRERGADPSRLKIPGLSADAFNNIYRTGNILALQDLADIRGFDAAQFDDIKAMAEAAFPMISDGEVEAIVLQYVTNDPAEMLPGNVPRGAKDMSVVKRREIQDDLRRLLMGENRDIGSNVSTTLLSQAALIENELFLRRIKEEGLAQNKLAERAAVVDGQELITPIDESKMVREILLGDDGPEPGLDRRVTMQGKGRTSPLSGLFAEPDFVEELYSTYTSYEMPWHIRFWLAPYLRASRTLKANKTIWSPASANRNYLSGYLYALANGVSPLDAKMLARVKALTYPHVFGSTNRKRLAYRENMVRLGLWDQGVDVGTMKRMEAASQRFAGDDTRGYEAQSQWRRTTRTAEDWYNAHDNVWKAYVFEKLVPQYQKALGGTREQAEEHVAEILGNTMQNYSMLPETAKMAAMLPVAGPFIGFHWEAARNSFNILRVSLDEIRGQSNPAIKKIAYRRLAMMLAALSTPLIAQIGSMALNNLDEEDDEAARRMMAPWNIDSPVFYLDPEKKGQIRYIDFGFMDPFQSIKNIVGSVLSLDAEEASRALNNVAGEELLWSLILDDRRNKTRTGDEVYNAQDTLAGQYADRAEHVSKGAAPGYYVSGKRMYDVATGERPGRVGDEAWAFAGFRITTIDIPKTLHKYKASPYKDGVWDARWLRLEQTLRKTATPEDRERGINKSQVALRRLAEGLIEDVKAARQWDTSEEEIEKSLDSGGLSKWEIREVMDGNLQAIVEHYQALDSAKEQRGAETTIESMVEEMLTASMRDRDSAEVNLRRAVRLGRYAELEDEDIFDAMVEGGLKPNEAHRYMAEEPGN